jgi:hypothetical protein
MAKTLAYEELDFCEVKLLPICIVECPFKFVGEEHEEQLILTLSQNALSEFGFSDDICVLLLPVNKVRITNSVNLSSVNIPFVDIHQILLGRALIRAASLKQLLELFSVDAVLIR